MSVHVLAFQPRVKGPQPWTNEELAELYRVVDIMGRAGLSVDTEMGMSDEGDPWFIFCRSDSGDVIAHFARIDGQFVAASVAVDETYSGANFRQIVERMVSSQPLVLPMVGRGTRLLMHPSVVLTAFVATALAHSEKAHADPVHVVEAKWDHGGHATDASGGAGAAGRHVTKLSWFDSFRSILAEARSGLDVAAESSGQAVTLASLIAIAMAAMQPVVEKLSAVAASVVDGIHAAEAAIQPAAAHVFAALADLPVFSGTDINVSDTVVVKADADSGQPNHKVALDVGSDPHGAGGVSITAFAAPSKAILVAEDTGHVVAPPVAVDAPQAQQAQVDAAELALMTSQKAAAFLVAQQASSASSAAASTADMPDVNQQALQILNIHLDNGAHPGKADSGTTGAATTDVSLTSQATSAAALVATIAPPQIIDVTATNGSQVITAIANFAASSTHLITAGYTAPANLQQTLAPYTTPGQELKIIVFESTSLTADIFQFSSDVVFVEEKYLNHTAALSNPGGSLILDLSSGGTVTLVGVATIGHVLT